MTEKAIKNPEEKPYDMNAVLYLTHRIGGENVISSGSGFMISRRHVITAAHNVVPLKALKLKRKEGSKSKRVYDVLVYPAGKKSIQASKFGTRGVVDIWVPKAYKKDAAHALLLDLAVLTLDKDVKGTTIPHLHPSGNKVFGSLEQVYATGYHQPSPSPIRSIPYLGIELWEFRKKPVRSRGGGDLKWSLTTSRDGKGMSGGPCWVPGMGQGAPTVIGFIQGGIVEDQEIVGCIVVALSGYLYDALLSGIGKKTLQQHGARIK